MGKCVIAFENARACGLRLRSKAIRFVLEHSGAKLRLNGGILQRVYTSVAISATNHVCSRLHIMVRFFPLVVLQSRTVL